MQTGDLGNITIRPRGQWNVNVYPNSPYEELDFVSYNGSAYLATRAPLVTDEPGASDAWMLSAVGAGTSTPWTQLIIESGTVTYPYDGLYLEEVQGGGGGSGGVSSQGLAACGGAAAGEYKWQVASRTAGETATVTIGAGGLRGATTTSNGGNGGHTMLGPLTVSGGNGSVGISAGSSFAIALGGAYSDHSAGGRPARFRTASNFTTIAAVCGGDGESTVFGPGGQSSEAYSVSGSSNAVSGKHGVGYGSGASGASASSGAAYGGNGAQGCVRITYLGA